MSEPVDELTPERHAIDRERLGRVLEGVDGLTAREMAVFCLRFRVDPGSLTQGEIAECLGITRERVHQLEKAAVEKLRKKLG